MCYEEGMLQAYLDRELPGRKRWEMEAHIETCDICKDRLLSLEEANRAFLSGLSVLSRDLRNRGSEVEAAWARLARDKRFGTPVHKKGVFGMVRAKYKAVLVPLAITAILAISFGFTPVREAAADLLNIFRVQKVEVIKISPSDMAKLQGLSGLYGGKVDIENFGKIETDGFRPPMMTQSLSEAQKAVDFKLKLPVVAEGDANPKFIISNGSTSSFTLDVEKANEMIKSLNGKVLLPVELDGKKFTVRTPVVVVANYPRDNLMPLSVMQARTPEFVFPEGVDPDVVRDALLDIPIIPENIKTQLKGIEDWKHTLPIPSVEGQTEAQEVTVNGAEGAFIIYNYQHVPGEGPATEGTLLWQDNVVIRGVSGQGLDLAKAQEIAASMR